MNHYIWQKNNWTDFTWDEKKLLPILSKVRLRQGQLITKIKSLGAEDTLQAQANILIEETIKTSQIEGETYDPHSVRSSVNKQLGLKYAGLPKPQRDIEGLVSILLDATINSQIKLTADKLKSWQAALFPTGYSGLRKIKVGNFRNDFSGPMQVVSGPINREKVHYQAPPAHQIKQEIDLFINWWNSSQNKTEGIIRAGVSHFYFITIHPFEDGNGRIARALTDMTLAQDDKLKNRYYSLSEQILKNKNNYYKILEKTQKGNLNLTEWLIWFIDCFDKSLQNSEKLLTNIFAKVNFWQKHQNIEINTRQRKVVNKLLNTGKNNFKGGLTNKKYIGLTKISRATAYREITDLLNKKIIKLNKDKGRNVNYDLNW